MRPRSTSVFTITFTALLFWAWASNVAVAAVHINLHGGPFPSRLEWTGKAFNVMTSRRSCPLPEQQLVAPILVDIAAMIDRFHGGRVWVPGVDRSSLLEVKSGFRIGVARTKNFSYVIFLDRNNLSKDRFEKILPDIFDCINVSFGSQAEARALLLFPPDGEHRATPLYSPAIGFYLAVD